MQNFIKFLDKFLGFKKRHKAKIARDTAFENFMNALDGMIDEIDKFRFKNNKLWYKKENHYVQIISLTEEKE